jgi:hypothetical protein
MKISNIQKVIYLVSVSTLLLIGCAKIVAPTGGPKDEQHPLIVESNPPSHTTNFDKNQINITFDEFIQLKDLNQHLIISPPVEEKPMIRVKGKALNIRFYGELQDSTTYNIYFGSSVQDFNEGNPIENFQYVLSTGENIDSLSVEGVVLNAFNLLPEEGVFVMLYKEKEDSVPIKQIPNYISKTNKDGYFRINNISHNQYKIFCLRDANRNYLFDKPNEDIAFIDSLIQFELVSHEHVDTLYVNDSLHRHENNETGEIEKMIDTIITEIHEFYPVQNFTLRLFTEDKRTQYLAGYNRDIKEKMVYQFNKPVKDSLIISLIDTVVENDWYIKESNLTNDTIFYWITDSSLYNKKELLINLEYQKEDSNLVYHWTSDTLNLKFFEQEKRGRNKEEETEIPLNFKHNISGRQAFDLNKDINLLFEKPISQIDDTLVRLVKMIDSLEIPAEFSIIKDSAHLRKYFLSSVWSEDTAYQLEVLPGAFTDLYESTNDTSIINFKTQKFDFYGKLIANITGIDSTFQLICQLILPAKESESVLMEKIITSDQLLEFQYLHPKEYIFKVILDKNFNGKWDTGEYLEHIQPEEVLYYDKEIKVRSNWDIEISFNVNKGLKE